jgi:hypothetical protein
MVDRLRGCAGRAAPPAPDADPMRARQPGTISTAPAAAGARSSGTRHSAVASPAPGADPPLSPRGRSHGAVRRDPDLSCALSWSTRTCLNHLAHRLCLCACICCGILAPIQPTFGQPGAGALGGALYQRARQGEIGWRGTASPCGTCALFPEHRLLPQRRCQYFWPLDATTDFLLRYAVLSSFRLSEDCSSGCSGWSASHASRFHQV